MGSPISHIEASLCLCPSAEENSAAYSTKRANRATLRSLEASPLRHLLSARHPAGIQQLAPAADRQVRKGRTNHQFTGEECRVAAAPRRKPGASRARGLNARGQSQGAEGGRTLQALGRPALKFPAVGLQDPEIVPPSHRGVRRRRRSRPAAASAGTAARRPAEDLPRGSARSSSRRAPCLSSATSQRGNGGRPWLVGPVMRPACRP